MFTPFTAKELRKRPKKKWVDMVKFDCLNLGFNLLALRRHRIVMHGEGP